MKGSHRPGIGLVLVFLLLYVVYTFAPALLYNMAEKKSNTANLIIIFEGSFKLPSPLFRCIRTIYHCNKFHKHK